MNSVSETATVEFVRGGPCDGRAIMLQIEDGEKLCFTYEIQGHPGAYHCYEACESYRIGDGITWVHYKGVLDEFGAPL